MKNWTIPSEFIPLGKGTTNTGVRRIIVEFKGLTHVRKLKDDILDDKKNLRSLKAASLSSVQTNLDFPVRLLSTQARSCRFRDKIPIVITKSREGMQLFCVRCSRPPPNNLHFCWIWFDSLVRYLMPKE